MFYDSKIILKNQQEKSPQNFKHITITIINMLHTITPTWQLLKPSFLMSAKKMLICNFTYR